MKFLKVIFIKGSCFIQELLVFGIIFCFPLHATSEVVRDPVSVKPIDHGQVLRNDLKEYKLAAPWQKAVNSISMNMTALIKAIQKPAAVKPKDQLQIFRDDLKKYKPNAPWIIENFMCMDLKQFSTAFKYTVKILTVPQKRWFYFSNSPVNFDPENHWAECLWQCVYFEQWMSGLSMDENRLIYKDVNHIRMPFIKILTNIEQLGEGKNLINKYYQFYAFYTDCLSNFFCKAVYSCYGSMDDSNAYKLFLATAKKSLGKMKQNLIILKKSKFFYANYKMTLDSYKKILALLEAEKIKTYIGSE